MSSQMSMRFHRHLTSTILILSKKVAGKNPNKIGTILGSLNDTDVIGRIISSH